MVPFRLWLRKIGLNWTSPGNSWSVLDIGLRRLYCVRPERFRLDRIGLRAVKGYLRYVLPRIARVHQKGGGVATKVKARYGAEAAFGTGLPNVQV